MTYPRLSLYALMLAAVGIPLYIHLPRFASVELGLGLGAVGSILLALRLIDLVQDPAIGWTIDRWPAAQPVFAVIAAGGLAIGFPLLFTLTPDGATIFKLFAILVLLFSSYSLGSILLYGRSATLAERQDAGALMSVAAWREGGMLAGVLLSAIAPAAFLALGASRQGYPAFGFALGALAIVTIALTLPMWRRPAVTGEGFSLSSLAQTGAVKLLLLALVNSLPVAVTSTLFLFFVEDRLQLGGSAGPLLVLFFLSAGLSVPLWANLSQRIGERETLLVAMPLAIIGFIGAALLGPGNLLGFALVCIASGAAIGADMVILPAMFSILLTHSRLNASMAFGIWSFATKLGLALAAATLLPLLQSFGFTPGGDNSRRGLAALNAAYAILPCLLKLLALSLVFSLPAKEHRLA